MACQFFPLWSLIVILSLGSTAHRGVVVEGFSISGGIRTVGNNELQQRHLPRCSSRLLVTTLYANKDPKEKQTLGLLTFDLDDTLYPIAIVEEEANRAFVDIMARYGFGGLGPNDIVESAKEIRDEMSKTDPDAAAALTHDQVRKQAIRREMEKATVAGKLEACAADWATDVDLLSPLVKENAKKWATAAVSRSMVQAVSTAWERERHHSAERHLYPEVLEMLQQIRDEHPTAIIGAVTDGRSNPLLMVFTLAPYFDFRCSWEDDQGTARRQKFFQELDKTEGDPSELSWLYDEARYNYAVLKQAADVMTPPEGEMKPLVFPDTYDDRVWIHVGDDLAFDVGGSAACGAKTIYCELEEKYQQTARHRYDALHAEDSRQPSWSITSQSELKKRREMAQVAESKVDARIKFLTRLPEAINDILAASQ